MTGYIILFVFCRVAKKKKKIVNLLIFSLLVQAIYCLSSIHSI